MTIQRRVFLALILATNLIPGSASALEVNVGLDEILPAASACQAALPQFAGTLRARPLAIANEGSQGAFVTCGGSGSVFGGRKVTLYHVTFFNRSSAPAAINCTAVETDIPFSSSTLYTTRTVNVAAGAFKGTLFLPEDFGRTTLLYSVRFNCRLPPGTEIKTILISAGVTAFT